ncbi:MAG: phosphatidate cytidylyltransferase, partial [bacterium]
MNTSIDSKKIFKDPKKFVLRVISALFLFLLVIFLLYNNWNLFVIFVIFVQVVAIYEISSIFSKKYYVDRFFLFVIAFYFDVLVYINSVDIITILNNIKLNSDKLILIFLSIIFIFLIFSINFVIYLQNNLKDKYKHKNEVLDYVDFIKSNINVYDYFLNSLGLNLLILFYVVIPFSLVIFISSLKNGNLLMLIVFTNFFNDIFAYFFGKIFGNRKFFEFISPNKTLEGFIGGFIGGILGGLFWVYFSNLHLILSLYKVFVLIFLMSLFAPFGDLFASFIKRSFDLKETSNVIPGHGGVLDRFDS